jgi:glyoxylase-like metal-dependent hydrolase (beta-lactamase superfamily II)
MCKKILATFSTVLLLSLADGGMRAQDSKAVLQGVARALGAENLKCLTYAGTGQIGLVGQNFTPRDDWPKLEMPSCTKSVNFDARASREERVLRQGSNAARGGGGMPLTAEQRRTALVSGNFAWNAAGTAVTPMPEAAEQRQLEIWLTPHGFIKGALAATNPVILTRNEGAEGGGKRRVTMISFTALGKYRVNATVNAENLIERVQTWVPNPIIGDMNFETMYRDYKDFGGVRFPTRFHAHDDWDDESSGNPQISGGHNSFDINVSSVEGNACADIPPVPDAVRTAKIATPRVVSEKLADGVYLLGGGSHNSVAVEFRDYVAVVEAPLNEERSLAVIAEVRKLTSNRPINYVVNTHHHFDHSGGLRTYVHEDGSAIITYRGNREFFGQEVFSLSAQRTLQPDRLSLYPPEEAAEGYRFETVVERFSLGDDTRVLEVHRIQGQTHADGLLAAYLPKEKILIQADLFTPRPPAAPGMKPTALEQALADNVRRLKLDVARMVSIEGPIAAWGEFLKISGVR